MRSCAPRTSRHREGFFGTPSLTETVQQCVLAQPDTLCPVDSVHGLPLERQQNVPTRVPGLLSLRRPSAVFGAVRAVVVDAVKGIPRAGALPHVRQELLKSTPKWVNIDAPSTVPRITRAVRVGAACPHCAPGTIFGGVFLPVTSISLSDQLTSETPAGQRFARVEARTVNGSDRATLAAADPVVPVARRARVISFQNEPTAKTVTGRYGTLLGHRTLHRSGARPAWCATIMRALSRQLYQIGVSSSDFALAQQYGLGEDFWHTPTRVGMAV